LNTRANAEPTTLSRRRSKRCARLIAAPPSCFLVAVRHGSHGMLAPPHRCGAFARWYLPAPVSETEQVSEAEPADRAC